MNTNVESEALAAARALIASQEPVVFLNPDPNFEDRLERVFGCEFPQIGSFDGKAPLSFHMHEERPVFWRDASSLHVGFWNHPERLQKFAERTALAAHRR